MKKLYLLTLLLIVVTVAAEAQSFYSLRRDRNLIATAGANTSTYYGDLKDDSDIIDAKPSLSVGLIAPLGTRISARGELSWITLSGSDVESADEGRMRRNLSFQSHNFELAITGIVHLFEHRGRFYQRPNFNAYGFAGIGGLYFNPTAQLDGKRHALQPLATEGVSYSRFAFVLPYGLGARAKLTPFVDLAIEVGWRKTFTDYLDDVSTVYVDNASFTDPIAQRLADRRPEIDLPVQKAGSIRGNPDNKDGYMLLSAKVLVYLPRELGNNKLRTQKRGYKPRKRSSFR